MKVNWIPTAVKNPDAFGKYIVTIQSKGTGERTVHNCKYTEHGWGSPNVVAWTGDGLIEPYDGHTAIDELLEVRSKRWREIYDRRQKATELRLRGASKGEISAVTGISENSITQQVKMHLSYCGSIARHHGESGRNCQRCKHYEPFDRWDGKCNIIKLQVYEEWLCDAFEEREADEIH